MITYLNRAADDLILSSTCIDFQSLEDWPYEIRSDVHTWKLAFDVSVDVL